MPRWDRRGPAPLPSHSACAGTGRRVWWARRARVLVLPTPAPARRAKWSPSWEASAAVCSSVSAGHRADVPVTARPDPAVSRPSNEVSSALAPVSPTAPWHGAGWRAAEFSVVGRVHRAHLLDDLVNDYEQNLAHPQPRPWSTTRTGAFPQDSPPAPQGHRSVEPRLPQGWRRFKHVMTRMFQLAAPRPSRVRLNWLLGVQPTERKPPPSPRGRAAPDMRISTIQLTGCWPSS